MVVSSLAGSRQSKLPLGRATLLAGAVLFFSLPFFFPPAGSVALVCLVLCAFFLTALGGAIPGFLSLGILELVFWYNFLPPFHSFAPVPAGSHPLRSLFFLAGAAAVLSLARFRSAFLRAEERLRWTDLICRLIRGITGARGSEEVLGAARIALGEVLPDRIGFFLLQGTELRKLGAGELLAQVPEEGSPVWQVLKTKKPIGPGSDRGPGEEGLFLPLALEGRIFGVMEVYYADPEDYFSREKKELLEAVALQVAAALEREESAASGHREDLEAEGEKLRSSLLRSLSHDFRTPLAGIAGTAEYLLAMIPDKTPDEASGAFLQNRELLANIHDEAAWLSRVLDNILSLTRFDSVAPGLRKEAEPVEEVVGSALNLLSLRLADYPVDLRLPRRVLMVPMESSLIEQVLVNLLDNAMKYSEPGSPIEVSVAVESGEVVFEVADRGRGFPPEDQERIFHKFNRGEGPQTRGVRGTGLGLSICQAIVEAHGGGIRGLPRPGGGARFIFTLPLEVNSHG